LIIRNDPPAPSTGTRIGTVGSEASKGSGKYRDKGGTIMIKRCLPKNKNGSAHHLGKIMARSMGSQRGKYHKKRDIKKRSKQKERSSKVSYSFKGRQSKETYEVRCRLSYQSKICGRQSGMARLKHMHKKRNPLGKEFLEISRRLTRMEQVEKYAKGTFHILVASKGKM